MSVRLSLLHALAVLLATVAPQSVPAASVVPLARARELGAQPGTPVAVRGTVTRYRTGRSVYLRDATGAIFAYTAGTDILAPGDLVEVSGISGTDENGPLIDKGIYRRIGGGDAPLPVPATADELARGQHSADLVSVDGTLARVDIARFEDALVLRSGNVEFECWIVKGAEAGVRAIEPGSHLRAIGTASIKIEGGRPVGFEILMRTGSDVIVLQSPSWWTSRHIAGVAIALAAAVLVLLLYIGLLRRQVARQTALILARVQAESDLKEQYRQAQKMETVGRLAGGIAHDFNNIMTVVLGYSEVLAVELKDHPDLHASVAEIQHAAERAAALTRQLLAFGRQQAIAPSPVELNEVILDMAPLFARVLGGDIKVDAIPDQESVVVISDRPQLEQALLNLAVNARDAMPDGGRLTLSVSRRRDPDGHERGVLLVADTGTGIPDDAQAHVFDPFFTTKEIGAGSGLGLAMVYGFVQQSGATIRFDTAADQGTTFELAFPMALSSEVGSKQSAVGSRAVGQSGSKQPRATGRRDRPAGRG